MQQPEKMHKLQPGRAELACELADCPRIAVQSTFEFVCAGCGDCCRKRKDLLLSGLDLYRIARRLDLPPHIVAHAFCREEISAESCLPLLRLHPNGKTGNCPFFDGDCTIHAARPLACALYPLGQAIDPMTAQIEYYAQTPLCGTKNKGASLQDYLDNAGISTRTGTDARWAVVCTRLEQTLRAAGGREHPRYKMAMHRMARALYYDYSIRDEFYSQFAQNIQTLQPLLNKILENNTHRSAPQKAYCGAFCIRCTRNGQYLGQYRITHG